MLTFLVFKSVPVSSSNSSIRSSRKAARRTDLPERPNSSVPRTPTDTWHQRPHSPTGDRRAAGGTRSVGRACRCTFPLICHPSASPPPWDPSRAQMDTGRIGCLEIKEQLWFPLRLSGPIAAPYYFRTSSLWQPMQAALSSDTARSRCHTCVCSWSWCYPYRLTSFLPQIFPPIITHTIFV